MACHSRRLSKWWVLFAESILIIAADVMYQQAKRLEVTQKTRDISASDLAVKQARSYLAAINALSLLDKQQAWLPNALPQGTPTRVRCWSVQGVSADDSGYETTESDLVYPRGRVQQGHKCARDYHTGRYPSRVYCCFIQTADCLRVPRHFGK